MLVYAEKTCQRIRKHPVALVAQDTTELDAAGATSTQDHRTVVLIKITDINFSAGDCGKRLEGF